MGPLPHVAADGVDVLPKPREDGGDRHEEQDDVDEQRDVPHVLDEGAREFGYQPVA